ncbi:hypothetical protein ABT124_46410 [Streptomyces sp. NPDC001982]|uniref:hypothetical protein n=1 Tax=Streptomyces sp. NPDC001982 TaxID=3154405 RepID=UPI00331893C5
MGPANNAYLRAAAAIAEYTGGPLVAGRGTHALPERVADTLALPGMHRLRTLALTQAGHPHHPLRLRGGPHAVSPLAEPGDTSAVE